MVSENDVLEVGWCIWCVFVSNFELSVTRFDLRGDSGTQGFINIKSQLTSAETKSSVKNTL